MLKRTAYTIFLVNWKKCKRWKKDVHVSKRKLTNSSVVIKKLNLMTSMVKDGLYHGMAVARKLSIVLVSVLVCEDSGH